MVLPCFAIFLPILRRSFGSDQLLPLLQAVWKAKKKGMVYSAHPSLSVVSKGCCCLEVFMFIGI